MKHRASKQSKIKQRGDKIPKTKPKRQFFVEEHRKQIDDYMFGRINRNKKSLKNLKKEMSILKNQMVDLQEHNKKQISDYQMLTYQVKQIKENNRFDSAKKRSSFDKSSVSNCSNNTRKEISANRDLSDVKMQFMRHKKKNSSFSSTHTTHTTVKNRRHEGLSSPKLLVRSKIQELKKRACKMQDTVKIKAQVKRKIEKTINQNAKQQNHLNTSLIARNQQNAYQQLMKLLTTTKKIQQTSNQIPQKFKNQYIKQRSCISIEKEKPIQPSAVQEKSLVSTNREPQKNFSSCITESKRRSNEVYTFSNKFMSESNLLQSSSSLAKHPKEQKLKLSRCVDIQVVAEQMPIEFEGLFQSEKSQASHGHLSFDESDNTRRRLRELEFQFDQLIRQQLLANDSNQKNLLAQTIRTVLGQITEIKDNLAS